MIHVDGRDNAVFEAAADQEKKSLDLLFGENGCYVGVVLAQAVVESHQAEVAPRRIFSGQESHRRFQGRHLVEVRESLRLAAKIVQEHSLDPRKAGARQFAHVVIGGDVQLWRVAHRVSAPVLFPVLRCGV